jgi:hypothetical protein
VSIDGAGLTINANGNAQVLVDQAGDGVDVLDVTITGMGGSTSGDAAAILSEGGAMSVENCTITNNTVSSDDGDAGVILSEGGALEVTDSTVSNNTLTAGDEDVAALLSEGGALSVSGSDVNDNTISTGEGDAGAIVSEGGALEIDDTVVQGNTITSDDGDAATIASEGGALAIVDSTVLFNTTVATDVAAGGAHAHGDTRVDGSLIACNSATANGEGAIAAGALAILGENLTLIDSTIQGNTASGSGAGSTAQQLTNDTAGCVAPPPNPPAPPVPVSPTFTG